MANLSHPVLRRDGQTAAMAWLRISTTGYFKCGFGYLRRGRLRHRKQSELGNSGRYLFEAASDQGVTAKGSNLLQWLMVKGLKDNGIRYYNLGDSNPQKNPGVYHFRQGLSGQDLLYMPPLVSCANVLSAAFVKAGKMTKGRLRQSLNRLLRAR